jgi:tetratricopeptide (TPR) repeat protein
VNSESLQADGELATGRGRREGAVLLVLVVLGAMLMAAKPISSPDVWHHVKSGWLVAQQGPATGDVFSHTARGKRWVQYEWLAQLSIYGVNRVGGVDALMALRVVVVGLVAALFFLTARVRGASPVAAAMAVLIAMCALSERFFTRPELFTWVCLGGVMLSYELIRKGKTKLLWLPPLLMIPWANCHGAWVAGLAWMGLTCGGDTIAYWARMKGTLTHWARMKGTPKRRVLTVMWVVVGLSFAAPMINPYGAHIWEVPFELSRSAEVRSAIAEWAKPGLDNFMEFRFLGIPILLISLILAFRQIRMGDWLVVAFFGVLSTKAVRHPPLALLIASPIMAVALCQVGREFLSAGRRKRALSKRSVRATAVAVVAALCATIAFGGLGFRGFGWGMNEKKFPIGATRFLEEHQLDGNLYNTYDFGNYLLYARYPANLVFIDGRIDMYGAEVKSLYDQVRDATLKAAGILDAHSVSICVIKTQAKSDTNILKMVQKSKLWALVYWDDISAIYVKKTPERAAFLGKAYQYAVSPDTPTSDLLRSRSGARIALRDYEHSLARTPDCAMALWGKAECLRQMGKLPEAVDAYGRALLLIPDGSSSLYLNYGTTLFQLGGRDADVEAAFLAAVRLAAVSDDKSIRAGRWRILMNLSFLYERQGRMSDAVRAVEGALPLAPQAAKVGDRLNQLRQKLNTPTRRQP